jgi:uncharacterized membrane protein
VVRAPAPQRDDDLPVDDREAPWVRHPLRHPTETLRAAVSGSAGIVAGVVGAFFLPWQMAVLVGWGAAAIVFLVWVFLGVLRADHHHTRLHATREDNSLATSRVLLVSASLASLVGVALALVKGKHSDGWTAAALNVSAVVTVVLSWAVVHAVYMLRYANEYYTLPVGGIDFPGDDEPSYKDFAYLAFTIGMTYQVSDTNLVKSDIRHAVLRHALLSYVFGTVVVAMTINVLLGFIH